MKKVLVASLVLALSAALILTTISCGGGGGGGGDGPATWDNAVWDASSWN